MIKRPASAPKSSIIDSAFKAFSEHLSQDASIDRGLVERMRALLLEEQDYSAEAIRNALFPENLES